MLLCAGLSAYDVKKEPMKILCIMHADFETPGVIQDWARDKGYAFLISKPYQGEDCLRHQDFDLLVVMGGPQSACALENDPYLYDEVTLIQRAITAQKMVIGFCLGAQLIGQALGAQAERNPEKEIGVFPITLTAEGQQDRIFKDFPKTFSVIHWHNDMPGLAKDSLILAASAGCPRQIVKYSSRVYGLQCHLEITKQGIETMTAACPDDFKPSVYTQTPQELLEQDYAPINRAMYTVLDRLINA